jgi:hypothetical protein
MICLEAAITIIISIRDAAQCPLAAKANHQFRKGGVARGKKNPFGYPTVLGIICSYLSVKRKPKFAT